MRFMLIVKASKDSEAGVMPTTEGLAAMGRFNEELVNAGIMKNGDGLHPSSRGARVTFDGDSRTVVDGPFAETKELVAGYWIWEAGSKAEALEWLKKAPFKDGETVELRPLFEAADFGEAFTPELQARDEALRVKLGGAA
jgi:hypothetical protein